jgi:hypothetical protein
MQFQSPKSKNLISPNSLSSSFKKNLAKDPNSHYDIIPEKLNLTIDIQDDKPLNSIEIEKTADLGLPPTPNKSTFQTTKNQSYIKQKSKFYQKSHFESTITQNLSINLSTLEGTPPLEIIDLSITLQKDDKVKNKIKRKVISIDAGGRKLRENSLVNLRTFSQIIKQRPISLTR